MKNLNKIRARFAPVQWPRPGLMNFDGWFIKLSVQTFQQLIVIYRSGNLVITIGDEND